MTEPITLKIESQDFNVSELFKDFYSVPDFQREYVWQREQVEKLLQDIYNEFYDGESRILQDPEYFLGSIVACKGDDGTYQLIDGQQRMTTLYLLLCVLRDTFKEIGVERSKVLESQIADAATDPRTYIEVERYRVTLQYEDSAGVLEKVAGGDTKLADISETTVSVKNILAAYRNIREFLVTNLGVDLKRLREFHGVLTTPVKMIRIVTPTIANVLKVFETIDDRGVGLDAIDLLKNLLFIRIGSKGYGNLKKRWKTLVDTLHRCREKPLRFLRYYIMAHHEIEYHRGIREDEIYAWFVDHAEECGINTDPMGFVDRLCQSIENLFFCYIITREPTKTFERNFARWSANLCNVKTAQDFRVVIARCFIPDMQNHSDRFDFAFRELTQDRIQQYRIRYILAKLTQYVEEQAWGNPAYGRIDHYIAEKVEIEHILPANPRPDVRDAFDKLQEYATHVGRLVNLTLLEKTINGSVRNGSFKDKASGYKQSSFLLTKSLVEKPQVGVNTQLNRAVAELIQFGRWNSAAIQKRQEMLAKLARKVWAMPEAEGETVR